MVLGSFQALYHGITGLKYEFNTYYFFSSSISYCVERGHDLNDLQTFWNSQDNPLVLPGGYKKNLRPYLIHLEVGPP